MFVLDWYSLSKSQLLVGTCHGVLKAKLPKVIYFKTIRVFWIPKSASHRSANDNRNWSNSKLLTTSGKFTWAFFVKPQCLHYILFPTETNRVCSIQNTMNKLMIDSPNTVEHNGIHLDTLKTENWEKKGPRSSALFNIMVFYLLETFDGAHQM